MQIPDAKRFHNKILVFDFAELSDRLARHTRLTKRFYERASKATI